MDADEKLREKACWKLHKHAVCCNIPQNSDCIATYLPSHKLSQEDKQDIQSTAGEVMTNL